MVYGSLGMELGNWGGGSCGRNREGLPSVRYRKLKLVISIYERVMEVTYTSNLQPHGLTD
jgi:hypothetical protein